MKKQQLAIVTGGASGIGLAIAESFTKNKIRTIIIGRDKKKLQSAKKKLGNYCEPISFDLTNLKEVPNLIKYIIKNFGYIDILVNNAGINQKKEFTEVTDEEFSNIIQTNLQSVFSISREVVKKMILKKRDAHTLVL